MARTALNNTLLHVPQLIIEWCLHPHFEHSVSFMEDTPAGTSSSEVTDEHLQINIAAVNMGFSKDPPPSNSFQKTQQIPRRSATTQSEPREPVQRSSSPSSVNSGSAGSGSSSDSLCPIRSTGSSVLLPFFPSKPRYSKLPEKNRERSSSVPAATNIRIRDPLAFGHRASFRSVSEVTIEIVSDDDERSLPLELALALDVDGNEEATIRKAKQVRCDETEKPTPPVLLDTVSIDPGLREDSLIEEVLRQADILRETSRNEKELDRQRRRDQKKRKQKNQQKGQKSRAYGRESLSRGQKKPEPGAPE